MALSSPDLILPELVHVDANLGATKEEVIAALAATITAAGRCTSTEGLIADITAREGKAATGLDGGIAIPHCRSAHISKGSLAVARLNPPVDFGAADGQPADLVFLIAGAESDGKEHMKLLSKLARALVRDSFRTQLRTAATAADITQVVQDVINAPAKKKAAKVSDAAPAPAADNSPAPVVAPAEAEHTDLTRIVAVTACPTGIAHTYMAADALQQAADSRTDVELYVETQGSADTEQLDQALIDRADVVIFATEVGVRDRERFAGKPVVESSVKRPINNATGLLDEAIAASKNPAAPTVDGTPASPSNPAEGGAQTGWGRKIQQAVMTGVSYMIPFVAAGGLLIALSFLLGGYAIPSVAEDVITSHSLFNLPGATELSDGSVKSGLLLFIAAALFMAGSTAMSFLVAALSGYIAYGLAGRPGIAPGFIGGAISVAIGAGFIGGLVTGILAGVIAAALAGLSAPRWLKGLMPVVIIPLLTALAVALIMYGFLGGPLAHLMDWLQDSLTNMSGSSAVLLGIIVGLMMCFDLGGPVNKAAYLFATAGLSAQTPEAFKIMAAVMAAGMVPPLAMGLATLLRKKLFTPAEQENGIAALPLGLAFISEGAIPFAAADPFRVIPSMMLGGAITGGLSMALGVGSRAPHGGLFVLFAIDPWWGFIVALAAGVAVSTVAVIAAKSFGRTAARTGSPTAAPAAA